MKSLPPILVTGDIYQAFVENAIDGLLVIDAEGIVRFANPAARALFADRTSELLGFHLGVPAVRTPTELILPHHGGIRYVEMVAAETLWEGSVANLASLRDITERKRLEIELTENLGKFRGLVEQSIAGIYLIQDGKLAYVNPRCAEIVDQGSIDEIIGTDPLAWVAKGDRDQVADNIRRLLDGETRSVALDFRVLRRDGATVQVGANASHAAHNGRPAVIGVLQDISEKKRAQEEIQRYIDQLKLAFMSSVDVATMMSELRDPYTTGHERRVADLASVIGAELGFDAQRQEGLLVSGRLHDVGKIAIPAEILAKPGRLSKVERELIQRHAQTGYDVLKTVKFPWPVAEVALQHHERMDGSGYPQGLKGDGILFEARIMAVADVVEAMSSHRPYRAGLGIEPALAEIERGRGTAYDADAADACLRLFRENRYQIVSIHN